MQCKLDVACYVLNNTKPRYSVSSRGIVHHEMDYINKLCQNIKTTKNCTMN
ncbi:MAG: late competence development ComFB family protein [Clostridia bacterium]|nr:late competence development ComFB family protein [Clostridia bacterium]